MSKQRVRLLEIYPKTADEAWHVLNEEAGAFGDNGGEPDGPSYYRETDWFSPERVVDVVESDLGNVVGGWHETDYTGSDEERERIDRMQLDGWCGYSGDGDLYYTEQK